VFSARIPTFSIGEGFLPSAGAITAAPQRRGGAGCSDDRCGQDKFLEDGVWNMEFYG